VASWKNISLLEGGDGKINELSAQLQEYLQDYNLTISTSVNVPGFLCSKVNVNN
jgi:hypothetical protein